MKRIEFNNLYFSYDDYSVFENANLMLKEGEIICLFGKNGTGKTTLLKIISTLIKHGVEYDLKIDNEDADISELRKELIYVPSEPDFYENLNYEKNIDIVAHLWNEDSEYKKQVKEFLNVLNFDLNNTKEVRVYSQGMRYKLALALFFSLDRKLILLDEPLKSLDNSSQNIMIDVLKEKAKKGNIIFFSSHSTELKENLANNNILLENKKLFRIEGK